MTHQNDGSQNMPGSESSWSAWINADATRNFILGEPLLDWLALYGESAGFQPDTELKGYDRRCDFNEFVLNKGIAHSHQLSVRTL